MICRNEAVPADVWRLYVVRDDAVKNSGNSVERSGTKQRSAAVSSVLTTIATLEGGGR